MDLPLDQVGDESLDSHSSFSFIKQELRRKAERQMIDKQQQLFQLRSIRANLKTQEQRTKQRQAQRKANQEAQKSMPRRLGRLKFVSFVLQLCLT